MWEAQQSHREDVRPIRNFLYEWLEAEFDTVETRSADPFYISEKDKAGVKKKPMLTGKEKRPANWPLLTWNRRHCWQWNTISSPPEIIFYNGVGHVTVKYGEVLAIGFPESRQKHRQSLISCVWQMEIIKRSPVSGGSDDQL